MKYLKKIFDWGLSGYEPERPKLKTYNFKGRTYYLRKRKTNASSKSKRR